MSTRPMPHQVPLIVLSLAAALLAACNGSGAGLDDNGLPITSGSSSSSVVSSSSSSTSSSSSSTATGLTPDIDSIQANIFTPICSVCHSGSRASEGLQLDAGHAFAAIVGVKSVEKNDIFLVAPGDPANSYVIQKLEGLPTISGNRMPLNGPFLDQATIDVIAQWIRDGAPPSASAQASLAARRTAEPLVLSTASPPDGAVLNAPLARIAVGFNHELDASLVSPTAVQLDGWPLEAGVVAPQGPLAVGIALARGNPGTMLIVPQEPLGPGVYQLTLHGRSSDALGVADLNAQQLQQDQTITFTVESDR